MVKQGYKQTEIGVIPEDWDVVAVETLATDMSDGPFGSNLKKDHYTDEKQARVIQLSNIGEDGWIDSNVKYTTFSHAKTLSRCIVQPGHIIIAKMMPAGRAIICPHTEKMYILGSDAIKLQLNNALVDTLYFMYSTKSDFFQTQIKEETQGSTRARTSISKLRKNKVILPPVVEQKRIAEALSDVDSMISSLEKLIAKQKAIKQGAMQELLTGKKRLLGFTGEWNTFVFGELFDFIPNNAFTRAQMSDSGKVKNIHYDDILTIFGSCIDGDSNSIPYINQDIDLTRFADRCYLQSGDVIIADTAENETVGKALEIDNVNSPILAGQHTLLCRPKIKFANKFLGYYLNATCYHDQLLPFIVGTKVSSVSKSSIAQTKLVVPDFEEQTAIASILSDMDNAIEALEQKLEKTRQIKQGMMQQLLTGKIRLV